MEKLRDCRSYLDYLQDPQETEAMEMRSIFVHEKEREQGIGTNLLKELVKKAEERGYKRITTYSSTDSTEPFGAFLNKNGFIRTTGESNYGGRWELKINAHTGRVEGKGVGSVGKLLGNKKASTPRTCPQTIKKVVKGKKGK